MGGVKEVLTLYDGINWTALLAETAIDALRHVNVISSRPSASVLTLLGLDGDGLSGADGLAKLASNATLFTGGVSSQCVLASEPRRDGTLLERIEDGVALK